MAGCGDLASGRSSKPLTFACCSLVLLYCMQATAAMCLPQSISALLPDNAEWFSWLHEQAQRPLPAILDTTEELVHPAKTETLISQILTEASDMILVGTSTSEQTSLAQPLSARRRLVQTAGGGVTASSAGESFQGGPQQSELQSLAPPTFPGVANLAISGQTNLGIAQPNGALTQPLGVGGQTITIGTGSVPPQGSLLSGINTGILPTSTTSDNGATLLYNPSSGRKLMQQSSA